MLIMGRSTRSQPASSASSAASVVVTGLPSTSRAPAMLRSSLKTAPVKPKRPRRTSFSHTSEKPAGRWSTFG